MDDFNDLENQVYQEPSPEDFIDSEEDIKEQLEYKECKAKRMKKIAGIITAMLMFQVFAVFFSTYTLDVMKFLRTSYRLSQIEEVQVYKEAVVTIQGDRSRGTGFAISDDGVIITNHHVIENQKHIAVVFQTGEPLQAEVVRSDPKYDIAILQVEVTDIPHFKLTEVAGISNEPIIVIGNPLSFTQIANEGIVLTLNDQLLISAPIYRGNSGSPVINSKGEVIGVVYAKSKGSEYGGKSVGIATPIEKVIELVNE